MLQLEELLKQFKQLRLYLNSSKQPITGTDMPTSPAYAVAGDNAQL